MEKGLKIEKNQKRKRQSRMEDKVQGAKTNELSNRGRNFKF